MVNGLHDIEILDERFDLYLGGGLGATYIDFHWDPAIEIFDAGFTTSKGFSDGAEVWTFTAQALAGLTVHITDNVALTGGYRLQYLSEVDFDGVELDADLVHGISAGLRITF
jgi:opacity protein-like surface antigen